MSLTDTPVADPDLIVSIPPEPEAKAAPVLVYESEFAQVWHGDARDVLATLPTESVDLILCDPPYGVEWQSNLRKERFAQLKGDGADAASRSVHREILEQCVRIVGQHRHLYVFGPADILHGLKISEVVQLIWDKGVLGSGDVTSSWGPQHEPINFFISKHRHAGKAGASTLPTRMRKGSVLRFMRPTGRKVRTPSEKPVPLLCELIESSSRRGDTVVDPYAGSGSTAAAAIISGRKIITCELDDQFIPLIVERVKNAERIAREAAGA